jgi:hypothetical protein
MLPASNGIAVRGEAKNRGKEIRGQNGGNGESHFQSRSEIEMWFVFCKLISRDWRFVYRLEKDSGQGSANSDQQAKASARAEAQGRSGSEKTQSTGD